MGNFISVILGKVKPITTRNSSAFTEQTTPAGNPVPAVVHHVIRQKDLGPGRLVIVGDIHGCFDELQQLLAKLDFQHGHDNLILVGDLVNKGPQSAEVVSAVRSLCSSFHCWSVRGNHDDAALAARRLLSQGQGLVKPKYQWVKQLQPEDEQFMTQLPFSLQVQGYGILVVHAGLLPGLPLHQQRLVHMTKMRDVQKAPNGRYTGLEKSADDSQPWAATWTGPQHVFFGHDAKRRMQDYPYATGLDTGCVYGGKLTACVLPPLTSLQQDGRFQGAVTACRASAEQAAGSSHSRDTAAGIDVKHAPVQLAQTDAGSIGQEQSRVHRFTLEHLQGQFVDVDASFTYEKPGRKSVEALPSDMSIAAM